MFSVFFYSNLYVDDLSKHLRACYTGCMTGETRVNHLMYADDLVIFSPSAGLRQLLDICTDYGVRHDIKYNASKSAVLQDKCSNFPVFKLCSNCVEVCSKVKYLGHLIADKLNDDDNIYRQCRKLRAQANTTARKFSLFSVEVEVALFKS